MQIKSYHKLTESEKETFYEFLKIESKETKNPACVNMWDDDWIKKPNTLPYILEKTDRFKKGKFFVLFKKDEVIACSGIYQSNFCSDIAIAGTRTWIHSNYRNQQISREILLPAEKQFAIENKFKIIALTFNNYNKNLIRTWTKRRLGEKREPRSTHHLFYNNFNVVDFPVLVQYTPQFVIYEKLDKNFDYNWELIKCK